MKLASRMGSSVGYKPARLVFYNPNGSPDKPEDVQLTGADVENAINQYGNKDQSVEKAKSRLLRDALGKEINDERRAQDVDDGNLRTLPWPVLLLARKLARERMGIKVERKKNEVELTGADVENAINQYSEKDKSVEKAKNRLLRTSLGREIDDALRARSIDDSELSSLPWPVLLLARKLARERMGIKEEHTEERRKIHGVFGAEVGGITVYNLDQISETEEGRRKIREKFLDASGTFIIPRSSPFYNPIRIHHLYREIPIWVDGRRADYRNGQEGMTYYYGNDAVRVKVRFNCKIATEKPGTADGKPQETSRENEPADNIEAAVRSDKDFIRNEKLILSAGISAKQEVVDVPGLGAAKINIYEKEGQSRQSFFIPHDSETSAFDTGIMRIAKYGGKLVVLENRESRFINNTEIDPNRIFKPDGKYGTLTDKIFDLIGQEGPIITLHNCIPTRNWNEKYLSFLGNKNIKALPGKNSDMGNIIWISGSTPLEEDEQKAREIEHYRSQGISVVYEYVPAGNKLDGSLSQRASIENRAYYNVEIHEGDKDAQQKYLDAIMSYNEAKPTPERKVA